MKKLTPRSVALDAWRATRGGIAAIMARRQARLAELVAYARTSSRYFARHYRDVPETISDVRQLPPTDRQTLMNHFEDWVTDKAVTRAAVEAFVADLSLVGYFYLDRYRVCVTSGTTGTPAILLHDAGWRAVNTGLELARKYPTLLSLKTVVRLLRQRTRMTIIGATNGHFASMAKLAALKRKASPRLLKKRKLFSVFTPLPELVEQLNQFQPAIMTSFPTTLTILAKEQLAARLNIHPVLVVSSAETLFPEARLEIESAWGVTVWNYFGMTETGHIGRQCRRGQIHMDADWFILEGVDENDQPVPPGESSRAILVTNLANRIQPFIRYKVGDSLVMVPDPCPCGSPLPVIRIEGRTDEILDVPAEDGRVVHLFPTALHPLMDETPGVYRSQIVQTRPTQLEVRLEVVAGEKRDSVWADMKHNLDAYLAQQGVDDVSTILSTESPRSDPVSGKLRRVWAEIKSGK